MLGKNMLTSRQIKLEIRRRRCDICHEICKVYDPEDCSNGKLVRLKCLNCSWFSEGKVFLKEFNIPLQNRQRVTRLPEYLAIEKKENREEHLQHYSPFLSETPISPKPILSIKETRRKHRKLLKRKGLVDKFGKVEVIRTY